MSLQVWLPLNGDLHNQGLGNITVTSGTSNFKTNGKIGLCFDLNARINFTCPQLVNIQTFSIAFWTKVNADTSLSTNWVDIIGFIDATSSGTTGQLRWETCYGSGYEARGISSHDNTTNATSNSFGVILGAEKGKWYHIACTVDIANNVIKEYSNGVLVRTIVPNGGHLTGAFWIGQANVVNGELNDVRIYDHALSAKEVEEIAKGLVLHYKLDNNGLGGENLLPNTDFNGISQKFTLTYRTEGGFTYTPTTSIASNTTYTISCRMRGNANMNLYKLCTGGNESIRWMNRDELSPTTYKYFSLVFTSPNSSKTMNQIYICTRYGTSYSQIGDWFEIEPYSLKLEEGNSATRWSPAPSDAIYNALGFNNNIIYDSSGYNNNGTLTISPSCIISDSPRYSSSLCLSKKKISANTGFPTGANPDFTVVFWARLYSDITYVSYGDLVGMNDIAEGAKSPFRLELCGTPPSNNLMWFRGPSGQASGGFNMNTSSSSGWFSKGVWHQIALTGNGATKQYLCYLDGAQCGAYNGSSNTWTPNGKIYFGDTVEATADFSDCRVYATVLTAAQIKELYETSMSIDNEGNIYARELVEL